MALVSVPRPGFGTLGRPIRICANHFLIDIPKQGHFYHYDVDIEIVREKPDQSAAGAAKASDPPKKNSTSTSKGRNGVKSDKNGSARITKDFKRKIMKVFLAANPGGVLNGNKPVFDGEKNLYTMRELKIARGETESCEVVIPKDADGREMRARVTVKPCSPLMTSWAMLQDVIEKKSNDVPIVIIQCINTVFREAALATGTNIAAGRSFYWHDQTAAKLGGGRESWPGFYSSARPCQWKITLNLDVANTAFYEKQNVLEFLCKILNLRQFPNSLNDNQRRILEKEIRTLKVEVKHCGGIRRMRVSGLARGSAKSQTFEFNGKNTTVAAYFKSQYNIQLKYPDLPLLETGSKKNFIPIEICQIVAGQKVIKKLTDEQTAIMVKMCAKPAPERQAQVQGIREKVMNYDQSEHLKEFGIKVGGRMQPIEARVLPKPVIGQGHGTENDPKSGAPRVQELVVKDMDGTWQGQNVRYVTPKDLNNWVIIDLDGDRNLPLDSFLKELITTGRQRGMRISNPIFGPDVDSRHPDLQGLFGSLKAEYKTLDLIMIIMRMRGPMYGEIKKAGDVLHGIPTQVVLGRNISKSNERGKGAMNQLASNILLKINAKLGGTHSRVVSLANEPNLKRFTNTPTIVFGADVTHPAPGEESNKPSIAAVVASYNPYYMQYNARVRAQGHREEIMSSLRDMVVELMQEFKTINKGVEPQRIIFYRDGVSEGQYAEVMLQELRAIQAACGILCPEKDYKPPITYVIVGKRHHTRLFTENQRDAVGKAGNVPPGTITDRAICHFSEFDWFLCSHFGIQGTSRPAHYNVLYDDSGYNADEIQLFSYYLTYCYARCARSVSIPAPAYYAHLAAFRARFHMEDQNGDIYSVTSSVDNGPNIAEINKRIKVHEALNSRMYFA